MTILEGSVTLMMFPILVLVSYLADIGYFAGGASLAYQNTPFWLYLPYRGSETHCMALLPKQRFAFVVGFLWIL